MGFNSVFKGLISVLSLVSPVQSHSLYSQWPLSVVSLQFSWPNFVNISLLICVCVYVCVCVCVTPLQYLVKVTSDGVSHYATFSAILLLPLFSTLFLHALNPLNPELNPICYLLALLGAHHFLHVSRIRVKLLTFRLLMSYIYGAPILDVSRSHTTTHHSR